MITADEAANDKVRRGAYLYFAVMTLISAAFALLAVGEAWRHDATWTFGLLAGAFVAGALVAVQAWFLGTLENDDDG